MAYRIAYDAHMGKFEIRSKQESRIPKLFTLCFLCFLIFTFLFWDAGADWLRSFLIPGEDIQTIAAFQNMTGELRNGASLGEAIETFCREVIHGVQSAG